MINRTRAGLFCTCVALFLNIISAAVPYWWKHTLNGNPDQTVTYDYGTIRFCEVKDDGTKSCFSYPDSPTWLIVSFAMIFVAIGMLTISAVCTVLFLNIYRNVKKLCVVASFFAVLGAGAGITSVTLFAVEAKGFFLGGTFYASFGVAIVAIIVSGVAGILLFVFRNAKMKE